MKYKSFKVELKPNNKQKTLLLKNSGVARFVYNWGLATLKEDYESGKKELGVSAITLQKLLNSKKEKDFPWIKEISKWVPQHSLRNLEAAFKRFFNKSSNFPKFKKKNKDNSFTLNRPIYVFEDSIQLPKIGKIKLKEKNYIPLGSPKSATISQKAGRWFVSVRYEMEIPKVPFVKGSLGVDLGIKTFATVSDGTVFKTDSKYKKKEKKLKRLQRKLSRQIKGSKSREKTKKKIQIQHYKISCSRKDLIHKTTSFLVKTKPENRIVIEDLNVGGMLKNHCLAKSISNIGAFEFRRQLTYKCDWYGKELVVANRWFPSSKMDYKSGEVNKDLKLSDRIIYHSDGSETDRDLNAAINLSFYDEEMWKNTARYAEIKVDGDRKFISIKGKVPVYEVEKKQR